MVVNKLNLIKKEMDIQSNEILNVENISEISVD